MATACISVGPTPAHCLIESFRVPVFFMGCKVAWQVELAFSNASCFVTILAASELEIALFTASESRERKSSYDSSDFCLILAKEEEVDSFPSGKRRTVIHFLSQSSSGGYLLQGHFTSFICFESKAYSLSPINIFFTIYFGPCIMLLSACFGARSSFSFPKHELPSG